MRSATGTGGTPHDLRLLPAAATAWLASAGLSMLPAVAALASAVVLGCLAWVGARRWPAAVCLVLVVAAAAAAGVGLRLAARDRGPVDELADAGRSVVVSGTVAEEPRTSQRLTWGAVPQTQVTVRVRLDEVVDSGSATMVRQSVLLVAQGPGWDRLGFGQRLTARVVLHPAAPGDDVAAVAWGAGQPLAVGSAGPVLRGAERMRAGLRDAAAPLAPDPRGLLPALVVGDTSLLPDSLVADLRASGLAHLTAVSGANVAIVVVTVLLVARWAGVRGWGVPAVGVLAAAGFVVLARPQPSVLRAAVMGAVAVLAVAVAGRRPGLGALLTAVVGLLLVDPWLARSWGFALSAAACAGLLVLAPRWRERWRRRVPERLAEAVAVSLGAQVATLPLTVALSGKVSVVALPANLLAAPAVAAATVLGVAAAAVSPLLPGAAHALAWVGGFPAGWICWVARHGASLPVATVAVPSGGVGAALVLSVLTVSFLVGRWLRRRPPVWRWAAALCVAALGVAACLGPLRWPPPGWLLVMCDVGQGDGIVLAAAPGAAVVVDAGPDPAVMDRCLDRLGVDDVLLVVLTHDHADHVTGLPGVLDGRRVGAVLTSPLAEPTEPAAAVEDWAAAAGVPVSVAVPGTTGSAGAVTWTVLWPSRVIRGQGSDPNNASVVLLVTTHGLRVLLAGDVEPAAQEAIVAAGAELRADVLKVPHHGSANQDPDFLAAAGARLALVSVGEDNPYGHPDPGLLASLAATGAVVGRTDLGGDLAVVLAPDGTLRLVARGR